MALTIVGNGRASAANEAPPTNSLPLTRALKLGLRPSSRAVIAFIGDGHAHAAYELYVTNFNAKPIRILSLTVKGSDGAPFSRTWGGKELAAMFSAAAGSYHESQNPLLQPSEEGVIFVFLDFDSMKDAPAHLVNSVTIERGDERDTIQRTQIAAMSVNRDGAAVVSAPIAGDDWSAANGPSNASAHRRALLALDGVPEIGQRFAIDWVKLGADGNTYQGDPRKNSSYYAWNVPIMAAADGRVIVVKDGVPENTPDPADPAKRAVVLDLANLGGNHVVEDIGGGHYALYAHLRPGSITVKPGETVHRGQVIARLGNSGNSTEPHLHFQLCDAASFVISSGVPFALDRFTVHKYRIDRKGGMPIKLVVEDSRTVTDQIPMENELDDFGVK
ncbi:MAG: M23 family metallopeptidase [Candidatus Binataceae bacterium]